MKINHIKESERSLNSFLC